MKVITTIYQSLGNPDMGFAIQNDGVTVTVWIDEYEGGEACITDWGFLDAYNSEEEAYEDIVDIYGPVKKLDI